MVERSRELRNGATDLERKLWHHLRLLRDKGFHFRRQAPFERYVLDFVCHDRRLVVEIDGDQHAEPAHAKRDAVRDARLEAEGYRVLRFGTNDVRTNMDGVLDGIFDVVSKREAATTPTVSPSPQGGGKDAATRARPRK